MAQSFFKKRTESKPLLTGEVPFELRKKPEPQEQRATNTGEYNSLRSAQLSDQEYKDIRSRVRSIKYFYRHLALYVFATVVVIIINFLYTPKFIWFHWLAVLWGMVLAFHALSVFVYGELLGKEWEEQRIKAAVNRRKSQKNNS